MARALVGVAVVVAAVVLFVTLQGGGDDNGSAGGGQATSQQAGSNNPAAKPAKPAVPTIVVENGKPVGGIRELTYSKDDEIRFKVRSDVSDEVHVHGYDLMKDVKAGSSVSFDFPASIEGIFEAELESRVEQILELRVNP